MDTYCDDTLRKALGKDFQQHCYFITALLLAMAANKTLEQRIQDLPQELFDMIYEAMFSIAPNEEYHYTEVASKRTCHSRPRRHTIKAHIRARRAPSLLHVNRACRERYAPLHYGQVTMRFKYGPRHVNRWLLSLPKEHVQMLCEPWVDGNVILPRVLFVSDGLRVPFCDSVCLGVTRKIELPGTTGSWPLNVISRMPRCLRMTRRTTLFERMKSLIKLDLR